MKKLTKVLLALTVMVLAGLSSDSIAPTLQAESKGMLMQQARVAVIKDWAACYDLIFCGSNQRVAATYNGSANFSAPNYYDISYYNGGCGIVVTSVTLSTWCP